jgi:hypothetical protein
MFSNVRDYLKERGAYDPKYSPSETINEFWARNMPHLGAQHANIETAHPADCRPPLAHIQDLAKEQEKN